MDLAAYHGRIVDSLIGLPYPRSKAREQFAQLYSKAHDASSAEYEFPAEHIFRNAPKFETIDDSALTALEEMDRHGIDVGILSAATDGSGHLEIDAASRFPARFRLLLDVKVGDPMASVRDLRSFASEVPISGVSTAPAITGIPLNDKRMYPVYATCVELGLPFFSTVGVPGPRLRFEPQRVEFLDEVMYDFPELVFVMRHGGEPWIDMAVKLMLKWPNLYYSTSAFAPKHYPDEIIDFANTRGADKIIYAGYYAYGLTLGRIMSEMPRVPFRCHVWPKFLYENAKRVLAI